MSVSSPRLTIIGYYGLGNCGDEAVLAGLLRGLREAVPGARITVLSANPRATRKLHGVRSVHRLRGLLQSVMFCDALVAGGGSLLQDVTSQRSLLYYLFVLKTALAFGKKVVLLGQGIGPLVRQRSRQAVASVLNRVDAIALRDLNSRSLLKEIGVTRTRVEVCADLAFLLEPPSFEVARRVIGGEERCLALSLRPWSMQLSDEEDWRRAARKASALCEELGRATRLTVRLVPMQEPWDRILAEHAAMLAVWPTAVEPVRPPTETAAGFAAYRVVVAMRLHALVFAALADVPSVALSYDPKVSAFMEAVGRPEWILPHDAPPQQVAEAARRAYSYAEPYPPGRIEWQRRLARRNITVLQEVLGV